MFEIDPADFKLSVDRARAALATLDQQIEVAKSQDAQLKFQVKAAKAAVQQAVTTIKGFTRSADQKQLNVGERRKLLS